MEAKPTADDRALACMVAIEALATVLADKLKLQGSLAPEARACALRSADAVAGPRTAQVRACVDAIFG